MHPSISIAIKDLRLLTRDRTNFFFTFIFPLIFGVFFGFMYTGSGPSKMNLAVVDLDRTPRSQALREAITAIDGVNIVELPDQASGVDLVRSGKRSACIIIPEGFSAAMLNVFSGNPATLEVYVDPGRKAESGLIQGKLTELAFRQMVEQFTNPDQMLRTLDLTRSSLQDSDTPSDLRPLLEGMLSSADALTRRLRERQDESEPQAVGAESASAFMPIRVDVSQVQIRKDGPATSFDVTFPQAAAWGLLGAVMAFGVSLVQERSQGTLARLSSAPLSGFDIMLGKSIACFVTAIVVQIFLLATFALVFNLRPVAPLMLTLAIISTSICFSGIMVTLAVLGRTEGGASGMGRAVLLLLTIFGGGAIPLMFMPSWMQDASGLSPFKWAIVALEGGIWRDLTLREMGPSLAILLGVGGVCFATGAKLFRRLQLT